MFGCLIQFIVFIPLIQYVHFTTRALIKVQYPVNVEHLLQENESTGGFRRRWEVIQESLLQNFMSSHQLEAAILSYNHKYAERWDFAALHYFFNEVHMAYFLLDNNIKILTTGFFFSSLMKTRPKYV